ncbi:hypothetical protein ENBRE01_0891 [Enteropsectra breve]|nr:hypothetical protein ENBRE01_0891 [Enteropsectra breve]
MLVQSAIAYFMPAELSYPKSMEHYISVEHNEKANEKFFLPDLFLSSFLKTKINLYYDNSWKNALERVSQQLSDVDMTDSMPVSILRTSVQLQSELAELYIKASQEVPYELYETAGKFSGKVQSYMQENNAGLLEEVRKTTTTITVLVATYDIKLLKLIFQMRHGLFFKTKIKLTDDLVIQLLSYYEELFLMKMIWQIFFSNMNLIVACTTKSSAVLFLVLI